MPVFLFFLLTFFLSLVLTLLVKKIASHFKIIDQPFEANRKIHVHPVPLLGGLAVFLSFFLILGLAWFSKPGLFLHLNGQQLGSILLGSLILMIGGYLDDRYKLKPSRQLIFSLLAVLIILFVGGVNLKEITNPWGGKVSLDFWQIGGHLVIVDFLVFFWLLGMMFTTKLLDGLDGLVAGVTVIGGLMIFFLAMTDKFYQPDIALMALLFAAANLGFLFFNFHPAKIFLGEGGSLMAGFILGVLAIISGGKIATTLLVMGVAAMDVLFVIIRRLCRKKSPFSGDAGHLHYRLLRAGLSQRQTVLLFYSLAIIFGALTLFLQSRQKLVALLVLFFIATVIGVVVEKKKN